MAAGSLDTVVAEHTVSLGYIVGNIGDIKDTLKEISTTQRRMEILFERQSNHEVSTRESFKHVHERLDEHEALGKERRKSDTDAKIRTEAHCKIVEEHAYNGNKAYTALMWFLAAIGVLAVGTLYSKVWGS